MKFFLIWVKSRDGATAMEYALIAGGIAIGIVAAVFLMGDSLQSVFNMLADEMAAGVAKI